MNHFTNPYAVFFCKMLFPFVLVFHLAPWAPTAQAQDLGDRIDQLEQLSYAGTPAEIRRAIGRLENRIGTAGSRERSRFTLIKARAAALAKRSDRAIEYLNGLLDRRDELEPGIELRALNLATNLLVVNDRFETGFRYFREALELAPTVDEPTMRADTYSVAAEFHARIGEYSTAIEYANRAIAQVERDAAPRAHCVALERRARARLGLNDADSAIDDYRVAIELCEAVPDLIFSGIAHVGFARGRLAQGDPAAAETHLRQAIEQLAHSGFSDGELEARTRLAEVLLARGLIDEARRIMAPTMAWVDEPGSHIVRAEAVHLHARLAAAEDDDHALYEHLRRAVAFEQQHSSRIRQMRFTMLMSAQDDRARASEVELLRTRNALAELDRESRRQEELASKYGGVGAIVAGVLLTGLLIRTARERQRLQRLSRRDSLTGLYNHTHFFELSQQAFQRCRRSAEPFSLIIADVDLFKQVNDEHGHLVGDSVLARVGARLRSAFGEGAIIGRLGGEEFGVAMIDCDIDTAVARIEHFRSTLNRLQAGDAEPFITMSFGVVELGRERSLEVLYAHADQALYDAKDAGRNRVVTVARIDPGGGAFVT